MTLGTATITMRATRGRGRRLTAAGIVILYAAVGIAWIVLSDTIVEWILPGEEGELVDYAKGIGFIVVTALALFGLLLARDLAIERSHAELEASEERFRLLAERSQDLVYRYQLAPDRGFEYVSRAALAITGYTPEEYLAGQGLSHHLVHPDDADLLDDMTEGRWPDGLPLEIRWRRRDGTLIWTEHRFAHLADGRGGRWMEGSVRDVSARKAAEQDAAATHARLRALVEASPLAIVAVDRDATITSWSPAAEAILGFTAAEVVGRPASVMVTDDPGWVAQGLSEVLAGDVLRRVPVRYRHRDGHLVDLHFFAGPIRAADGSIAGAVVVAEDVGARASMGTGSVDPTPAS